MFAGLLYYSQDKIVMGKTVWMGATIGKEQYLISVL
jgi:hypothetical protein